MRPLYLVASMNTNLVQIETELLFSKKEYEKDRALYIEKEKLHQSVSTESKKLKKLYTANQFTLEKERQETSKEIEAIKYHNLELVNQSKENTAALENLQNKYITLNEKYQTKNLLHTELENTLQIEQDAHHATTTTLENTMSAFGTSEALAKELEHQLQHTATVLSATEKELIESKCLLKDSVIARESEKEITKKLRAR